MFLIDPKKRENKQNLADLFKEILPVESLTIGKDFHPINKFKNYTKNEIFLSIDEMIQRPFLESLILAFFFTNDMVLIFYIFLF